MRVAAIYDVHGNLPALEAVLDEVRGAHVDLVVVGGDVVPGPMPREALALLLALDIPTRFIQGNGDRVVLEAMAGADSSEVPERYRDGVRWVAEQLQPEYAPVLAAWPKTLRLHVPALGDVLFCHATPRSDTEIFTRRTPDDDRLLPLFGEPGAPVVVCGHTHMQFDRMIGPARVVNAGSVGMPFGQPGADWLLLGPAVERRHTPYDLEAAAARVRATSYPQAEEFATVNVLHPPSEDAMLDAFSKAELK
jgi:diadenosine tetraphosphatase ApaH/serine/threonine PP2A family protein phosphatase